MIKVLSDNALHAYIPLLPAVKTKQPQADRIIAYSAAKVEKISIPCKKLLNGFLSTTKLNFQNFSR